MKHFLFFLLSLLGCEVQPSKEARAEKLITTEIVENSMGWLEGKDLGLVLERIDDSTYSALYTIPTGVGVERTYFFDRQISRIRYVKN